MFSFTNHCLNQRCKQDQILKIKTIITRPAQDRCLQDQDQDQDQNQNYKTKIKTIWNKQRHLTYNARPARPKLKPRPIFWSETGLVLRPTVSDHITFLISTQGGLSVKFTPNIHLSHFCPMLCQFILSFHFHVAHNSVHMHLKLFLATTRKHLWKETSDLNLNQPVWMLTVTAASASPSTDNMTKIDKLVDCFYTRTITNVHVMLYFTISWT